MKKNCKTLHTVIRTFTKKQNIKGGGKFREVIEIDKNHHEIFRKILAVTNNNRIAWEFRGTHGNKEKEWRNGMADINEKLIDIGIIISDENVR